MKIDKPGIYYDMASADYFADCCPLPSLTQSVAKILLDRSPLHAWTAHPRLNPDYRHDDDTKFDVGNIAHKLMIGRGKELVVLDEFDDWRTKAAKEARAAAEAEGKLAVLGKKFMIAQAMVRKGRDGLEASGCADAFAEDQGLGEVVIAWKEPQGFWCRAMIDWLALPLIYDYKTTAMNVAPHRIGYMMADAGWDIQAAMIERGLCALDQRHAGRLRFRFVAQEDKPPNAVTVCELSEAVMTMGRKKLAVALEIWNRCITTNIWPAYAAGGVYMPEYPGWKESQWLEREVSEFSNDLIMAG